MEREIQNYQFSIFGNFENIYNNINEISKKFDKFSKSVSNDFFPDGRILNCYILDDKICRIAIHIDRIDFIFNSLSDDDCNLFLKYYANFREYINFLFRIAINLNFFYKDSDAKLLRKISSSVNLFKKFGEAQEFSLRQNNVFDSDGRKYNDIITIQYGRVQKQNSFEAINAIILYCDINSAIMQVKNNNVFNNDNIQNGFETIFDRLKNKLNAIDSLLKE